jgi:hypothetical protein
MAGGASPSGTGLLERESELARIEQTVAAVERGHGGVLVIQCTAGIGESALLRAVCERATDQGLRTLTARPVSSSAISDFGVVRELLEARIVRTGEPERAELLAGDHLFMRASFPPRSNSPLAAGRLPPATPKV